MDYVLKLTKMKIQTSMDYVSKQTEVQIHRRMNWWKQMEINIDNDGHALMDKGQTERDNYRQTPTQIYHTKQEK